MIKIAILGNIGKTTTSEILYSYFVNKGYKTVVSNTSGIFVSDDSISIKIPFGTIPNKYYNDIIVRDDIDVLITELNDETAYKDFILINHETFDCVLNCSFNEDILNQHKNEYEDYALKYLKELNSNNKLVNIEDKKFLTEEMLDYITIYNNNLDNINYSFYKTEFNYKEVSYSTKLICEYLLKDINSAIACLESLNEFNSDIFQSSIENLYIRGRFDKLTINNKKVILDTGWMGLDYELQELVNNNILNLDNIEVILVPYHITEGDAIQWRKNVANYLKTNDIHCIVTSTNKNILGDFEKYYIEPTNYTNYEYVAEVRNAIDKALDSNKDYIFIMTNNLFRVFKNILEEKL